MKKVSAYMRERRRKSRLATFKSIVTIFLCGLIMAPAILVLYRGTPLVVFVGNNNGPASEETEVLDKLGSKSNTLKKIGDKQQLRKDFNKSDEVNGLRIDLKDPKNFDSPILIEGLKPKKTSFEPREINLLRLNFDKRRQVVFVKDIFPEFSDEEIESGRIKLVGLSNTKVDTWVERPNLGMKSGESSDILFTYADRVRISVQRERKVRSGVYQEVLEIVPEIMSNVGEPVVLNFDTIQRERRRWVSYAKTGPRPTKPLTLVWPNPIAEQTGLAQKQRQAAANAYQYEKNRREKITSKSMQELNQLEDFTRSLHKQAAINLVFLPYIDRQNLN